LGENVVVGAGAKVLGNLLIGNNVRIGAGSVVLRDVPSDCTVVGVPGRIVYRSGERVDPLEHGSLPDSEARVIRALVDRIENLEQQVQSLQPVQPRVLAPAIAAVSLSSNGSASNGATSNGNVPSTWTAPTAANCRIRDRIIEEFLDGSGI